MNNNNYNLRCCGDSMAKSPILTIITAVIAIGIGVGIGYYAINYLSDALTDEAEYDYKVTNYGTNKISTGSTWLSYTADDGYKYVIVQVCAKTIDSKDGIAFYPSDFKLKCNDGNEYPYERCLSKNPSVKLIMNGQTRTLSLAYQIPKNASPTSIIPNTLGVQYTQNTSLI